MRILFSIVITATPTPAPLVSTQVCFQMAFPLFAVIPVATSPYLSNTAKKTTLIYHPTPYQKA